MRGAVSARRGGRGGEKGREGGGEKGRGGGGEWERRAGEKVGLERTLVK